MFQVKMQWLKFHLHKHNAIILHSSVRSQQEFSLHWLSFEMEMFDRMLIEELIGNLEEAAEQTSI